MNHQPSRVLSVLSTLLLAGLSAVVFADDKPVPPPRTLDVLVVAPHSDDEAIGCTGVILRAIGRKQRVGVVIVTAGDGFPRAAAALAEREMPGFCAGSTQRERWSQTGGSGS